MTVGGGWSDQVTSCIARRHGVEQVQLSGLYGWKLCSEGKMSCDFDKEAYRSKIQSTSPKPLTFHYIGPVEMREIHQMYKNDVAEVPVLVQKQHEAEEALLCADGHFQCKDWADQGECRSNPDFMTVNCRLSCNTCEKAAYLLQSKSSLNFLQIATVEANGDATDHASTSSDEYKAQREAYISMVKKELAATAS